MFCSLQGFARHSKKDVITLLDTSVEALSGILGTSEYITGDELCPEDCVVFAVLDLFLNGKINEDDPLHFMVAKRPNLVSYVKRIQKLYFPKDSPSAMRAHIFRT